MKTIVKKLIRDEKGQAMVLVLILLIVGGLIVAPLLAHMGTGLIGGEVYERRAAELYAADAGVEDAIWRIQTNSLTFDADNRSYPEPLSVNNRSVEVVIYRYDWDPTCGENLTYQILSTATSEEGSSTAINAHLSVSYLDLSALLDNAIVSYDTIDIQPGNTVNGDVWLPDEEDLNVGPNVAINGTVYDSSSVSLTWPDAEALSSYYWDQVEDLTPSTDNQISIPGGTSENDPFIIERLSSAPEGEQLTVKGDGWIKLGGTMYVKGDLVFNPTPGIAVDLSQQTIFVEGDITMGPKVTLTGSGCIIAVGNIDFQPSITSEGDDFVLVMSITGDVEFHPSGDFTGCIAGNANVELLPGSTINWISPEGKGLDVPWGAGDNDKLPPVTGLRIESWEIEQH